MCNEVGCLAVFESREHPLLLLNADKAHFPPQTPVFSANGRYVCLKSQVYLSGQNRVECPLLLLDLYERQFTVLTMDTHGHQIAMENERLLTKESLLELLQEFNEQTSSLTTVLMEMGKLV